MKQAAASTIYREEAKAMRIKKYLIMRGQYNSMCML